MDTSLSNSDVGNVRVERTLDRILDKLQEQGELLARHGVLHEKNTEDLATHIKRTDLIEARIEQQDRVNSAKLDEALLPIKAFKFMAAMAAGGAAIYGLFKMMTGI